MALKQDQFDRDRLRLQLGRHVQARAEFYRSVRSAAVDDSDEGALLHKEHIFNIAELLTMMELSDLKTGHAFSVLLKRHEAAIDELRLLGPLDLKRHHGLTLSRLTDASFSDAAREAAAETFDQDRMLEPSTLAKLLFRQMSRETARSVIAMAEEAGMIESRRYGRQKFLLWPRKLVEAYVAMLQAMEGSAA